MASGDDEDREDLAVKRRRLTGETLLHLSVCISSAAEQGLWHGTSTCSEDFVNNHVEKMLQTLRSMVDTLLGPVALQIVKKASQLLQDL